MIIALHLDYPKESRRSRATTFPMHAWHPINQDPRFAGHGSADVTSLERTALRWVSHVAAEPASHQCDVTGRNWPTAASCNGHIQHESRKTPSGSERPFSVIQPLQSRRPDVRVHRSFTGYPLGGSWLHWKQDSFSSRCEIELLFSRRAGQRGLVGHFKAIGLRRLLQPDVVRRVVAVDGIGARFGWPRNGRSTCWTGSYSLPPCGAGHQCPLVSNAPSGCAGIQAG
ncbi:hypothetical protein P3T23_005108 [Paraburkholderia sp. GAS448]